MMKTCETCKANKVCDHNRFGFENCGNYISTDTCGERCGTAKYQNIVVPISNYATNALQETLTHWGEKGYRFVNSIMASNQYGCTIMYLFFVKGGTE